MSKSAGISELAFSCALECPAKALPFRSRRFVGRLVCSQFVRRRFAPTGKSIEADSAIQIPPHHCFGFEDKKLLDLPSHIWSTIIEELMIGVHQFQQRKVPVVESQDIEFDTRSSLS